MNDWTYADPDKPWEFLRFIADALEQGRELECEWYGVQDGRWRSDTEAGVIFQALAGAHKARARIKQRPLAPWWKKLEPDIELPDDVFLTSDDGTLLYATSNLRCEYWLEKGWTHYARRENILHGASDE